MATSESAVLESQDESQEVRAEALRQRQLASLADSMGPDVRGLLSNDDIVEVDVNPDGQIFAEEFGKRYPAGQMTAWHRMSFLREVASHLGTAYSTEKASIEGELPLFGGARFAGMGPPVVSDVMFAIRKRPVKIFTLDDYVREGILPFHVAKTLSLAILEEKNIIVAGGTGSGKTTFCNAILAELARLLPEVRVLLMEDTLELQCAVKDKAFLRADANHSMSFLLERILRFNPTRIVVGEVRSGAPALTLLKSWKTGHRGGTGTVHSDDCMETLWRFDELLSEVSITPQRRLIAGAINYVVYLKKTRFGRRVTEVARVTGYDPKTEEFQMENIYQWHESHEATRHTSSSRV